MTLSVAADGVITVTTTETTANVWDMWHHNLGLSYPAENNNRYAYEFEAWTDSGERTIRVMYIDKWNWDQTQLYKDITIDATCKKYTIVSDTRFDSKTDQYLEFFCGSDTVTGTFHVKMISIQRAQDYIPPQPEGGRWSAEATEKGILFTINMLDIPSYIESDLVIRNLTNGSVFSVNRGDSGAPAPGGDNSSGGKEPSPGNNSSTGNQTISTYKVVFPYVTAGKEYSFSLGSWNYPLAENITVTAKGGRGELGFSNANLLLINEGNFVKFNADPTLSVTETNAKNARYTYEFATGTSWDDPAAQWQISVDKTDPKDAVDLLDTGNFPDWADPSAVLLALAGKTSFAQVFYTFDYENSDIYPSGSKPGSFRTYSITSAPFTYPRVLSNVFTAEPCDEGVKFIVDLTKIPSGATNLQFHTPSWDAQCYVDKWEWENPDGPFYGSGSKERKVEIVFPFVNANTTYKFEVSIGGTGTTAEATVTPTAGLGEVKYSGSPSLIYTANNKTMTFQGVNKPEIGNSDKIAKQGWEWQFNQGHGWNSDYVWAGEKFFENLQTSVVFDDTFTDKSITNVLSGKPAFIQVIYLINYDGHDYRFEGITSPWFTFPNYDPVGILRVHFRSAFDTNNALFVNYDQYDDSITVWLDDYNWYGDYKPYKYYLFFIDDDNKAESDKENWVSIPTSELSPGRHFGLVVVDIDGAIFSKEFDFWVNN